MLPKTTPEQRVHLYEDVTSLLSPGFLTVPMRINGVVVHLRSLCPGDLFMLKSRAEWGGDAGWRLWTVASAMWMVDGISMLGQDHMIPVLARWLRDHVRVRVLDLMFHQVLGLFVRVDRAVDATQLYCYEYTSRYRWKTSQNGRALSKGAPGVENLGLNAVQSLWVAYNEIEDQRQQDENLWEGHKFLASPHAPKAVSKIDGADKRRRNEEQANRQAALDRFYYFQIGVITPENYKRGQAAEGWGARVQGPKSVEQLEDEMRKAVQGEFDEHDRIVMAYKEAIRAKQRKEHEAREQQRLMLEEERRKYEENQLLDGPRPLIGLTREQLQQHLSGSGWTPGISRVPDGPPQGEANYIHEKWVAKHETMGKLRVAPDGRILADGANPEQDMQRLNDMVRNRQVQFSEGG